MKYPVALTIAGSDSSGGAGIQADIKTMSAIGVYATSAITAITVQNTTGVFGIQGINPEIVAGQIDAVFSDLHPTAVKTGMFYSEEIIEAVADRLSFHKPDYIVVDPVMISTSGSALISPGAVESMKKKLFPLATIVTPNKMEAEHLSGIKITGMETIAQASENILLNGGKYMLVKGGHFDNVSMTDFLFDKNGLARRYDGCFVETINTHGTGCTFSSAIAAYLALGQSVTEAVGSAKQYLQKALECGANVDAGHGHGAVNHFFNPQKLQAK